MEAPSSATTMSRCHQAGTQFLLSARQAAAAAGPSGAAAAAPPKLLLSLPRKPVSATGPGGTLLSAACFPWTGAAGGSVGAAASGGAADSCGCCASRGILKGAAAGNAMLSTAAAAAPEVLQPASDACMTAAGCPCSVLAAGRLRGVKDWCCPQAPDGGALCLEARVAAAACKHKMSSKCRAPGGPAAVPAAAGEEAVAAGSAGRDTSALGAAVNAAAIAC